MRGACCYAFCLTAIITSLILFAVLPAMAASQPNIGTVLEGVKPPVGEPQPERAPRIVVEEKAETAGGGQQTIAVKGFRIGGEPPVSAGELLGLIGKEAGGELTLARLNTLAARLTRHLREKGYPVAFAYIPAQEVRDGIVEIAVAPGKYGEVVVRGAGSVAHDRLKAMFAAARTGPVITQGALERALLLMHDLSGVSVSATLVPSRTAGAADVVLNVSEGKRISGMAYTSNFGNLYTGSDRYVAEITVASPRGQGDAFTLGGLITGTGGLRSYNASYRAPLGYSGAEISVEYSRVSYRLGDVFAALDATGWAAVTEFKLRYPLIRSRSFSLFGSLGYDVKRLREDIAVVSLSSPRRAAISHIGLTGNYRDGWLGGGTTDFSVTYYNGNLTIEDAAAAQTDASGNKTAGRFAKTVITYLRRQHVAENLQFVVNATGQLATQNLDAAEKLFLGGPTGVRAFPMGEAAGDQGYKATGELRWSLPGLSTRHNYVYLAGFYDYGRVMENKHPAAGAAGLNRRSLTGAGLGLRWHRVDNFSLSLDYAWKIGREEATAEKDRHGRLWLLATKSF